MYISIAKDISFSDFQPSFSQQSLNRISEQSELGKGKMDLGIVKYNKIMIT